MIRWPHDPPAIENGCVAEDEPRVLRVSVADHSLFLTDTDRRRSWVVEEDDGKTIAEVLATVLRLARSDPDHLQFADPLDEERFDALVDPE